MWGNHIYNLAQKPEGVLIVPDSGIFVGDFVSPYSNSTRSARFMFQIINTEVPPPTQECLAAQKECNATSIVRFLKPPAFFIQSQYDLYGLVYIAALNCTQGQEPASLQKCTRAELAVIEDYREATRQLLRDMTVDEKNGGWSISCAQHGFLHRSAYYASEGYLVPARTGLSIL